MIKVLPVFQGGQGCLASRACGVPKESRVLQVCLDRLACPGIPLPRQLKVAIPVAEGGGVFRGHVVHQVHPVPLEHPVSWHAMVNVVHQGHLDHPGQLAFLDFPC